MTSGCKLSVVSLVLTFSGVGIVSKAVELKVEGLSIVAGWYMNFGAL
jgi:hypothetical protein